jgi:hypothetical protein
MQSNPFHAPNRLLLSRETNASRTLLRDSFRSSTSATLRKPTDLAPPAEFKPQILTRQPQAAAKPPFELQASPLTSLLLVAIVLGCGLLSVRLALAVLVTAVLAKSLRAVENIDCHFLNAGTHELVIAMLCGMALFHYCQCLLLESSFSLYSILNGLILGAYILRRIRRISLKTDHYESTQARVTATIKKALSLRSFLKKALYFSVYLGIVEGVRLLHTIAKGRRLYFNGQMLFGVLAMGCGHTLVRLVTAVVTEFDRVDTTD